LWIGELFVREKVPSKLPLSTTPENLPVDGFPAIETIAFTLQKRDSPTDGCCGAAAPFYFIFVNHKEKERERRFAVSLGSRRGGPGKALRCFPRWAGRFTAEKPPTGRFFWVVRIGSLSGGLFSYKSPLFCKLKISLQNSPAKALPTQRCFELCGARPAGAARWTPATF